MGRLSLHQQLVDDGLGLPRERNPKSIPNLKTRDKIQRFPSMRSNTHESISRMRGRSDPLKVVRFVAIRFSRACVLSRWINVSMTLWEPSNDLIFLLSQGGLIRHLGKRFPMASVPSTVEPAKQPSPILFTELTHLVDLFTQD